MKNQPNKGTVKDGLPTAEQVLHRHFVPVDPFDNLQILQAMREYADRQTAELRAVMKRLDKDYEFLSAYETDLSYQIEGAKHDNKLLKERVKELEGLMQEFVDRVDRGEVRSKRTYAKFKEALKK